MRLRAKWLSVGVALLLTYPLGARAHGLYAWINDGGYKAADGSHCCGLNDCVEVKPGDIRESARGAETPFGPVDRRAVYQSRDGKAWVCRRHFRHSTARSSCAFVPGGG